MRSVAVDQIGHIGGKAFKGVDAFVVEGGDGIVEGCHLCVDSLPVWSPR